MTDPVETAAEAVQDVAHKAEDTATIVKRIHDRIVAIYDGVHARLLEIERAVGIR